MIIHDREIEKVVVLQIRFFTIFLSSGRVCGMRAALLF